MRDLRDKIIETNSDISTERLDAFGRLKTANPTSIFDAQFTYDLQPLIYEQLKSGSGATITRDGTNSCAVMAMSATGIGGYSYLQTFEHFRYQPGNSQEVFMSFNLGAEVTGVQAWAGYYDAYNSIGYVFLQTTTGVLQLGVSSNTTAGTNLADQEDWNLDKLDGTGKSGKTLDITKDVIMYIDFQALYTGEIRFGFYIDDEFIFCHKITNSNLRTSAYIETANLPLSVGCSNVSNASATKSVHLNCACVISGGGVDETLGYKISTPDTSVTAGSGTRTHLMTLRPKTSFNSVTNRIKIVLIEINLIVTGSNSVFWELCLGQGFSVAPTYADINATYSSLQIGTGGTMSGTPAVLIDSGYIAAMATSKNGIQMEMTSRYPITLSAAGAVRTLGTLSLIVTGIGGTSATRGVVK